MSSNVECPTANLKAFAEATGTFKLPPNTPEPAGCLVDYMKSVVRLTTGTMAADELSDYDALLAKVQAKARELLSDEELDGSHFASIAAPERQTARDIAVELVTTCCNKAFGRLPFFDALVQWGTTFNDVPKAFGVSNDAWHTHANVCDGLVPTSLCWWTGQARVCAGTVVLGPSGSGKSVLIAHELAKRLEQVPAGGAEKGPVVTIMMKLAEVLGAAWDDAEERGDVAMKLAIDAEPAAALPDAVVAVITAQSKKFAFKAGTRLIVGLDEIAAVRGAMDNAEMWPKIAAAVKTAFSALSGVHVAGGGTGVGCGTPFASDPSIVCKGWMSQWSVDTLKKTIRDEDPRWAALVDALCSEPHGVMSAVTNPRMAYSVLQGLLRDQVLCSAWVNGRVNMAYVRSLRPELLRQAVRNYTELNGLSRIIGAAMNGTEADRAERQGVVRGIGLAALWVTMKQPPKAVVQADRGTRCAGAGAIYAAAAEQVGLLVSNFGKRGGKVEAGRLGFEMHAGTVLVALHLAGLDVTELPSTFDGLEALTALERRVTATCDGRLGVTERIGRDLFPGALTAALEFMSLPVAMDAPFAVVQWNARTALRVEGDVLVADMPKAPECPIVPVRCATMPDVLCFRCLCQCKLTFPDTKRASRVGFAVELEKAGLLKKSTEDQVALLDLLVERWKGSSRSPAKRSPAGDFGPGMSTLGPRHMYPLSLLLQPGAYESAWPMDKMDVKNRSIITAPPTPPLPSAKEQQEQAHRDQRGRAQRTSPPPAAPPLPAQGNTGMGHHDDWCEFRFVVTDPEVLGLGTDSDAPMNHVLAVFARDDSESDWALHHRSDGLPELEAGALQSALRTEMALTLVAVTVCHVCDPKTLRAGLPMGRDNSRPLSATVESPGPQRGAMSEARREAKE